MPRLGIKKAPIAVLPTSRGKGVASALINKKLKEIDEACLPYFLGTQDKENVAIYEKFAFKAEGKTLFHPILAITLCFDLGNG